MSAAALAKLLRKRLRVIFDNLNVVRIARSVMRSPHTDSRTATDGKGPPEGGTPNHTRAPNFHTVGINR